MSIIPTPKDSAFPPSWKKRRLIKAGEVFQFGDRVCFGANITKQLGALAVGETCNEIDSGLGYQEGWYWRKAK